MLTLKELTKTPEWRMLTRKQQMFVATYVQNALDNQAFDPVTAIRTAYKCKNDRSALVMSYRVMSAFNVSMCLSRCFENDPQQSFLAMLCRQITKGTITAQQIQAYKLYANIQGWTTSPVLQALDKAKEMGYGTHGNAPKYRPRHKLDNLKRTNAVLERRKKEAEAQADAFNLGDFEEE
jgi:PleD family two-component response regulator